MKKSSPFYLVLSSLIWLLIFAFFALPVYAQTQPQSQTPGDQLARGLGLSRDELIDWIKWIGIAITIFICYKGGAFKIGSKKTNKQEDDKK